MLMSLFESQQLPKVPAEFKWNQLQLHHHSTERTWSQPRLGLSREPHQQEADQEIQMLGPAGIQIWSAGTLMPKPPPPLRLPPEAQSTCAG